LMGQGSGTARRDAGALSMGSTLPEKRGRLHNQTEIATTSCSALGGHPTCPLPLNPTVPSTAFQKAVRAYWRCFPVLSRARWGATGGSKSAIAVAG
jgi:hypothetical protein